MRILLQGQCPGCKRAGKQDNTCFLNPLPFDVRPLSLNYWLIAIPLSDIGIFAFYIALSPLAILVLLPFRRPLFVFVVMFLCREGAFIIAYVLASFFPPSCFSFASLSFKTA